MKSSIEFSVRRYMRNRVLCLGNELLADDALGARVAERLPEFVTSNTDVVFSDETGLRLLDYLQDVPLLVVVDCSVEGKHPPGTIRLLNEDDFSAAQGASPHYLGLFEVLRLARALNLPAPARVLVVAVEAADTLSMGAPLSPPVARCLPAVLDLVCTLLSA